MAFRDVINHQTPGQAVAIAALEDPVTGGPLRQGEATRERRNRWLIDGTMTHVLRRFALAVVRGEACRRPHL